jgi:hypothetical protein
MPPSTARPAKANANSDDRPSFLQGHRFSLLLLFLLASLPIYPYAEVAGPLHYAFRIAAGAITLLTVWAVAYRRGLILLVLCLAIPAMLERVVFKVADASVVSSLNHVLSLIFDLIVIGIIFRHVYTPEKPDGECIIGAVCIYLLIGYSFAGVYGLIFSHLPHAFYLDPLTNRSTMPGRFDFVYFSFGTLTELGAPGMVAVAPVARAVSVFEAVVGILYLAVLISRLMSAYHSTAPFQSADASSLVHPGEAPDRNHRS